MMVEFCAFDFRPVPWTADSKSVFIAQTNLESDVLKTTYFQVDLLSGKQTGVSEASVPARPMAPQGVQGGHLAQGGRFLYFEKQEEPKSRIVLVHNLLSAP